MSSPIKILTLQCEEASKCISSALDQPPSLVDRVAVASHLLLCAPCRRFAKQMQVLRSANRVSAQRELAHLFEDEPLSLATKERIVDTLKSALPDEIEPNQ